VRDRKCEIMGTQNEPISTMTSLTWNDRVARELGIGNHEFEMKHFEILAVGLWQGGCV